MVEIRNGRGSSARVSCGPISAGSHQVMEPSQAVTAGMVVPAIGAGKGYRLLGRDHLQPSACGPRRVARHVATWTEGVTL